MRNGLPVVTADRGGPAWIIDASSGIRIPVTEPESFARDIAGAMLKLAQDPALRQALGEGARAKLEREGLWPIKAAALVDLYKDIIANQIAPRPILSYRSTHTFRNI